MITRQGIDNHYFYTHIFCLEDTSRSVLLIVKKIIFYTYNIIIFLKQFKILIFEIKL